MNHAIKFSYYAGFVGQQSTITNWCSVLEKQENRHWYHYAQISLINKIELRFKKKYDTFQIKDILQTPVQIYCYNKGKYHRKDALCMLNVFLTHVANRI